MRRKSDAKPVLTSPWKIGALVALLLVFISIGVGYYLVSFYHVKLSWLTTDAHGWSIDSYAFFREFYPLLAGVVIISLASYFIIASSVRRYKFYLDSGQDYRKMIALAESIDDLTSPTQIARLSSYPELQSVLRSYGDQIREISRDLSSKDGAFAAAEFDSAVEAILKGEAVGACAADKPWKGSLQKLAAALADERSSIGAAKAGSEECRSGIARTLLAHGRLMEAVSAVGGDCLEIVNDVHELDTVMENVEPATASSSAPPTDQRAAKAAVAEVEGAVRKLEDGGRVLREFAEETNGVALNIALMAAKGDATEQELAQFAEKVRGTAERFNRLCGTVSSLAQGMLKSCQTLKERMGEGAPAAGGASPEIPEALKAVAGRLENRTGQLQKRMCNIGSDLHDIRDLLQKALAGLDAAAGAASASKRVEACESLQAPEERVEGLLRSEVFHGARARESEEKGEGDAFVIDHGSGWEGIGESRAAESEDASRARASAEPTPAPESDASTDDVSFADLAKALGVSQEKQEAAPESKRAVEESAPARMDAPAAEAAPSGDAAEHDGSWMEMPGHRWVRIDVEKGEGEPEQTEIEIAVDSSTAGLGPDAASEARRPHTAAERAAAEKVLAKLAAAREEQSEDESPAAGESAASAERETPESNGDDPIYDLFDLGAVEYVEEIQIER